MQIDMLHVEHDDAENIATKRSSYTDRYKLLIMLLDRKMQFPTIILHVFAGKCIL